MPVHHRALADHGAADLVAHADHGFTGALDAPCGCLVDGHAFLPGRGGTALS